jgi:SAM-dependent methyltransferase
MNRPGFDAQFTFPREHYVSNLDMVTWLRHFHALRDVLASGGDVLEIGTGDGIVRRCAEPLVTSYKVLDINPNLDPDYLGDIRRSDDRLVGKFDTIVITEVMEHLPFEDVPASLGNLWAWLRPGGRMIVSVPHRKSSVAVITPNQKLRTFRFPNGSISLGEFYNRFIRRRIWIDPNHCWEIGDGHVSRADVEGRFAQAGFMKRKRLALPYSDYWVLTKPKALAVS